MPHWPDANELSGRHSFRECVTEPFRVELKSRVGQLDSGCVGGRRRCN
jgi:hypothetical protein